VTIRTHFPNTHLFSAVGYGVVLNPNATKCGLAPGCSFNPTYTLFGRASDIAAAPDFVSDASWQTFAIDPSLPGATPLGAAQKVCAFPGAPPVCPPGATLYSGRSGAGWEADLSSIPGASWIWAPGVTGSTAPADLQQFFFTRDFQLSQPPSVGRILLAVDDFAEVQVNGTVVGNSGSTTDVALAFAAQSALREFDILPFLRHGANTITIRAQNGPPSFAGCFGACTYASNTAGVVFGGSIRRERAFGQWCPLPGMRMIVLARQQLTGPASRMSKYDGVGSWAPGVTKRNRMYEVLIRTMSTVIGALFVGGILYGERLPVEPWTIAQGLAGNAIHKSSATAEAFFGSVPARAYRDSMDISSSTSEHRRGCPDAWYGISPRPAQATTGWQPAVAWCGYPPAGKGSWKLSTRQKIDVRGRSWPSRKHPTAGCGQERKAACTASRGTPEALRGWIPDPHPNPGASPPWRSWKRTGEETFGSVAMPGSAASRKTAVLTGGPRVTGSRLT